MKSKKTPQSDSVGLRHRMFDHWKNTHDFHEVIHKLPGYFRALLLDMIDNPMTYEELQKSINNIELRMPGYDKRRLQKTDVKRDVQLAIQYGVLEIKDEKYTLTPGGQELAQYIHEVIPFFFNKILSAKMVSVITIVIHILLSILKLFFGFFSRSAGLISDGIDNTVDTLSSLLVWLGIKYKKDRLVSLLIIIMMVISFVGIAVTSINKILHPEPVREGLAAFIVSGISGLIMLLLSSYQYITGKKTINFAILCQSVDSRNHFLTSLLVCVGILTSYIADVSGKTWLYYSDSVAAIIIGILIFKSFFELLIEFLKPENETTHVSHFVEKLHEKMKMKIIFQWLLVQLKEKDMGYDELQVKFKEQFCGQTPKINMLTGFGYLPKTDNELQYYLDKFLEKKKLIITDNKYSLNLT